mgnify:CR=1 FL=1
MYGTPIEKAITDSKGYFKIFISATLQEEFLYLSFSSSIEGPTIIDVNRDLPINRDFHIENIDFSSMVLGVIRVDKKAKKKSKPVKMGKINMKN